MGRLIRRSGFSSNKGGFGRLLVFPMASDDSGM
jgi:hypothetical protein